MLYEQTRVICDTHVIRNTDKTLCYTSKNALLVGKLPTACWQLATRLLSSTDLLQVCSNNLLSSCNSTICQQVVSDNSIIITTCWQAGYKPVSNTSCWQVVRFLRVYMNNPAWSFVSVGIGTKEFQYDLTWRVAHAPLCVLYVNYWR
jgi:hypothetical protein